MVLFEDLLDDVCQFTRRESEHHATGTAGADRGVEIRVGEPMRLVVRRSRENSAGRDAAPHAVTAECDEVSIGPECVRRIACHRPLCGRRHV
jgi:hypothetical protein